MEDCKSTEITKVVVSRVKDGVCIRTEFCCKKHSSVPYIETYHTVSGAIKLANDIVLAVSTPKWPLV